MMDKVEHIHSFSIISDTFPVKDKSKHMLSWVQFREHSVNLQDKGGLNYDFNNSHCRDDQLLLGTGRKYKPASIQLKMDFINGGN